MFRFKHVCIESFALHLPPHEVSSAELEDRIAPLYQRLGVPFGTLEKLSGIRTRYFWRPDESPSTVASRAAEIALEQLPFDRSAIGAVFNCSVTRDYFEPATACLVHKKLGLPETAIAFDISNACLGFSNGLTMLATLIESGAVRAGLVVSGENISPIIESSIAMMLKREEIGREELLNLMPTFTLGCGAAAFVLCHESLATRGHRIAGAVGRTASEHSDLCVGNADYCVHQKAELDPIMHTESPKLIASAAKLGGRTWKATAEFLGWSRESVSHVFCHQVGKQVNEAFYAEMGLDFAKEFSVYSRYGNLVSVALPAALITGAAEKEMKSGEQVVLTGFGSGLNSLFTGIVW